MYYHCHHLAFYPNYSWQSLYHLLTRQASERKMFRKYITGYHSTFTINCFSDILAKTEEKLARQWQSQTDNYISLGKSKPSQPLYVCEFVMLTTSVKAMSRA